MNRRAFFNLALLYFASSTANRSWSIDSETNVGGDNNTSNFSAYKQQHLAEFNNYKKKLAEEFEKYKKINQKETEKFKQKVAKHWDQPELSSQKIWVEYSSDLNIRKKVDFEKGIIEISTISPVNTEDSLREQLTATLKSNQADAFKNDQLAQNIETSLKQSLSLIQTAIPQPTPILLPDISDMVKQGIKSVDHWIEQILLKSTRTERIDSHGLKVTTLAVPLQLQPTTAQPQTHTTNQSTQTKNKTLPNGTKAYRDDIADYSNQYNLDSALIYAVIETESAFNPMAKSPIPAFGLMQIVPESAGMDATEFLLGKAKLLTPSYLYSSRKNIEIGVIYLHLLNSRYLKDIKDPSSRLYCMISAYNTGAGNVAKAFTGNMKTKTAIAKINTMQPKEVYRHLIENLPYKETRNYLKKVVTAIEKYA